MKLIFIKDVRSNVLLVCYLGVYHVLFLTFLINEDQLIVTNLFFKQIHCARLSFILF